MHEGFVGIADMTCASECFERAFVPFERAFQRSLFLIHAPELRRWLEELMRAD